MNNPWHSISPGKDAPNKLNAIIEIPKGSKNKYELDKESGLLKLDRTLFSSVVYPANYGFIPQTFCDDNDPLDILVLGQEPVYPLCLMEAKPIGMLQMVDQGEKDDKIIAVHSNDPEYRHYHSIDQLPPHKVLEISQFFSDYKLLENKKVIIEQTLDADAAKRCILEAISLYQKEFGSKKA